MPLSALFFLHGGGGGELFADMHRQVEKRGIENERVY